MSAQVLTNKGVSTHGEYFRSRLSELILNNIQFVGETEEQKHFCIGKFFLILNKFTNLESITMKNIQNFPHAIKCLSQVTERGYNQSLKHLNMEACILKEENTEGWVVQQPSPERIFTNLNKYINSFDNLESLQLVGMSICDHLGDLVQAVNRPKLKKLSLPHNGIEPEFCLFFKQMLPYETLEELNLSNNWFGMVGLARFKDSFKNFHKLRVLNFGNIAKHNEDIHTEVRTELQ